MQPVIERPMLPQDLRALTTQLQQVLQQYGYRINRMLPLDGSESAAAPVFIAPTFVNSWVNYGAPWSVAGYYKDPFGRVHLKGLVASGTLNSLIFTLPAGYRPSENLLFATLKNDGTTYQVQRIDVYSDGSVVQVGASGANNFVTLNGISFAAI